MLQGNLGTDDSKFSVLLTVSGFVENSSMQSNILTTFEKGSS